MSPAPDAMEADPQQLIADLRHRLDACRAELAALAAERDEAIAQQTATAEVLQAINASPGDLAPVFDAILEKARLLCEAAHGDLWTYDGQVLHLAATHGEPGFAAWLQQQGPVPVWPGSPAERLVQGDDHVQFEDPERDGLFDAVPEFLAQVRRAGVRSTLFVPMRKDGNLLGTIIVYRREVRRFAAKQITLLQNFAAQAVIAIENARLTTETREALEQQQAIAEVLQATNSSPGDLQPVFDVILEKAHSLCGVAHGALVLGDGTQYRAVATHAYSEQFAAQLRQGFDASENPVTRPLLEGARFVHIADMAQIDHPIPQAAVRIAGVHTGLWVPLRKDGALLGLISSARREVRPFTDKEIALLENFAAQAVIAMENARLLGELRERTRDLEESLQYQTATSDVLQVISRSTFDLQPVLDTLIETAAKLCQAKMGGLAVRQGDSYRYVATFSLPEFDGLLRSLKITADRRTVAGRVLLAHDIVHIEDIAIETEHAVPETVSVGNFRTMLGVPLLREGDPTGVIVLGRDRVEPFSARQIELVRTFADQAVIAIENTRLINETREALEQQTATAEVLGVINSSPGDLAPVFQAILEKAHALCGAVLGTLFLYDGDKFRAAATHGYPDEVATRLRHGIDPRVDTAAFAPLLEGARLVTYDDLRELDDPLARTVSGPGGVRTNLLLPLRKDGRLLGMISCNRLEVRPYTDKEIALLESFAAQAVIAMENARLLGELRERTRDLEESLEYQTATSEVLQVISRSTFDLQPVLDTLVETATRLCEADQGVVFRREGEAYPLAANFGFPAEYEAAIRKRANDMPPAATVTGRAIREVRVVHVHDVAAEPDYPPIPVTLGRQRTSLAVPLLRQGQPIGVIGLARTRVEPFTERQIELVRTFADQAVIAIENTRLLTELRESLEQQQAMAEILSVINSSPGNLQPLFEIILDKAHALCGATLGTLYLFDGETFRPAAAVGYSEGTAPLREIKASGDPRLAALRGGERLVHVADLSQLDDPVARAVAARGVRTNLIIPLRREGTLLGVITCNRHEVRPFAEKEIALLENFAAQAVIAMDNARLLDEIRQRQAELRVTFDNMGDGVAMFDAEMRLAAWNLNFQKILDLPDDLLTGRPTFQQYFDYLAARGEYGAGDLEAQLRQTVADTRAESRFERTRPDGRVLEVRRNMVPGGGAVLMYSDVTERKRAEEEVRAARDTAEAALAELKTAQANLIQAEKMASLGQLTAGIAHEIKNPLNFVNNFAGLSVELLDELKEAAAPALAALDDDTRAEIDETVEMLTGNLEKIAEHGRRADGIVKSMLEHSRGASGERRPVDLNALVEESLNLAYHGARAQDQGFNITLERDFAAAIAPVELVPQDVTRVFLNLFGNGFYAANKRRMTAGDAGFKPTLKVTTRDLGSAVEVLVRDNGIGMTAAVKDRLFQPFFTTKPTGEGTGLGLSISYDIVTQQHGGTITVDSQPDQFTEFTVRFPRAAATGIPGRRAASNTPAASGGP